MPVTSQHAVELEATLVSDAIRPVLADGGRTTVHSVHATVANIQVGEALITISDPSVAPLPNGIGVRRPVDFRGLGIAPGLAVVLTRNEIRVPSIGLVVSLAGASGWSPRLTPLDLGAADRWRTRTAIVRSMAAAASRRRPGARDGIGGHLEAGDDATVGRLSRAAIERLDLLCAALRESDIAAATNAAVALVGLGPGLTPSGDDALVGLSAAFAALGKWKTPEATFVESAAIVAATRTTLVGATFLRHAAAGEFSLGLHSLVDALLGADPSGAPGAIERTVGFGATSGVDTLTGLLDGLDVLTGVGPMRARFAA